MPEITPCLLNCRFDSEDKSEGGRRRKKKRRSLLSGTRAVGIWGENELISNVACGLVCKVIRRRESGPLTMQVTTLGWGDVAHESSSPAIGSRGRTFGFFLALLSSPGHAGLQRKSHSGMNTLARCSLVGGIERLDCWVTTTDKSLFLKGATRSGAIHVSD